MTQEELKTLFSYCPMTGHLTRKVSRGNTKAGDIAGSECAKGYLKIYAEGKYYKAHRLVWLYMTGAFPLHHVDHIDGQKDNNTWANLRDVTNEVNASNRHQSNSNNALGILGVHKHGNKYRASFKSKCLGLHTTPEQAHNAYIQARTDYESQVH